MNELQVFNYNADEVRTVIINGEPWFVGKDVAEILGYSNPSKALADHIDEEDKLNNESLSSLGQRGGWLINESGLYCLIMSSKLPTAKAFKRWVTYEVLPQIRKTGGYIPISEADSDDEIMAKAMLIANRTIAAQKARMEQLQTANSQLTVANQIMQPKADYFDELVDRNLLTGFRETAKELRVKERVFVTFLLNNKYIYRNKKGKLTPYAGHEELFEVKECYNETTDWSGVQTLITPKGRETFRLLLEGMKIQ